MDRAKEKPNTPRVKGLNTDTSNLRTKNDNSAKIDLDVKLKYPLIQIKRSLFQEVKPGVLKEWTLQYAKAKYGNKVGKHIKYYIDFTCEPNHVNHQRIIDDHYNIYKKLDHCINKGEWHTIEELLKHIFGEKDYQLGLEYLWNLYIKPKQKLPFIGLVSEKKGTGKTTFLNFLKIIFQENVSVVSSEDFITKFNDHFVNSLLLISDEHAEGKEQRKIAQKIKMLITSENIRAEKKFGSAYTTKTFFKMIFAGNDEDMLTVIEGENTRYWIIKVKPLKDTDINYLEKLKKEIPAFLYFLKNEFNPSNSRGRLYFSPEEFQTKAAELIQENSKSKLQKEIEALVTDGFEQNELLNEIYYAPKDLESILKKYSLADIRKTLKKEMNMKPGDSKYYPVGVMEDYQNSPCSKTGRAYCFLRSHYIQKDLEDKTHIINEQKRKFSGEQIEMIESEYYKKLNNSS
jgi:uncharacterized cupredoxin-like copper-binding protein